MIIKNNFGKFYIDVEFSTLDIDRESMILDRIRNEMNTRIISMKAISSVYNGIYYTNCKIEDGYANVNEFRGDAKNVDFSKNEIVNIIGDFQNCKFGSVSMNGNIKMIDCNMNYLMHPFTYDYDNYDYDNPVCIEFNYFAIQCEIAKMRLKTHLPLDI